MNSALFYIAALPVVLLLIYIYYKDPHKEPNMLLARVFILGCLSVIPIIVIELFMDRYYSTDFLLNFHIIILSMFVGVAFVEEFFKWIITYLNIYHSNHYDQPYDGIVYSVFASLGFAFVENVFYVLQNGFINGLQRAVTAVPCHMCNAVLMGYFLSLSKKYSMSNNNGKSLFYLILSILIPSITHTIYNSTLVAYSSIQDDIYKYMFFVWLGLLYVVAFYLIRKESKNNSF